MLHFFASVLALFFVFPPFYLSVHSVLLLRATAKHIYQSVYAEHVWLHVDKISYFQSKIIKESINPASLFGLIVVCLDEAIFLDDINILFKWWHAIKSRKHWSIISLTSAKQNDSLSAGQQSSLFLVLFVLGKHQQNLERGKATLLLLLIEANITRLEIVQPELHILLGISIQWSLVRSGGKIVGNMAAMWTLFPWPSFPFVDGLYTPSFLKAMWFFCECIHQSHLQGTLLISWESQGMAFQKCSTLLHDPPPFQERGEKVWSNRLHQ